MQAVRITAYPEITLYLVKPGQDVLFLLVDCHIPWFSHHFPLLSKAFDYDKAGFWALWWWTWDPHPRDVGRFSMAVRDPVTAVAKRSLLWRELEFPKEKHVSIALRLACRSSAVVCSGRLKRLLLQPRIWILSSADMASLHTWEGGAKGRWGQIQEGQARGAPNLPEERRVPKRWLHCYTATHTLSPMMYQLFQCSIVIDCHCMMLKIDGVQRMPGKALESRRQGLPSLHMFASRMHGLRLLFDRCMPLGNLSEDGWCNWSGMIKVSRDQTLAVEARGWAWSLEVCCNVVFSRCWSHPRVSECGFVQCDAEFCRLAPGSCKARHVLRLCCLADLEGSRKQSLLSCCWQQVASW